MYVVGVDNIKLQVDDPALDFSKARDLAKGKAGERCNDPMLLSWHNGKTG
ncbi:MAG: AF1514 family protein, partial [Proteobacteria bacterium]|nr:AF1514 family protein [Pseudomonadota bacterium]